MQLEIVNYLVFPLIAFVVTYAFVPLLIRWAPCLGLLDMPGERRVHAEPIPRCGGIAVFAGVTVAGALLYLLPFCAACGGGAVVGMSLPFWADFLVSVLWFLAVINAFNLIECTNPQA